MQVRVAVVLEPGAGGRPEPGTPVRVELRDTSLADAPAVTVEAAVAVVGVNSGLLLATVDLLQPRPGTTVWAHVDVDSDGQVSVGDLVTTESIPLPSLEQSPASVTVTVRKVR